MTPHIAGRVEDYPKHLYPIFKTNLLSFLESGTVSENQVDFESGY